MTTFQGILGSRLKALFADNYTAGTWTDEINSSTLIQVTANQQPVTNILKNNVIEICFDAVDDYLNGGLSVNPSGGYRLEFAIILATQIGTNNFFWSKTTGNDGLAINSSSGFLTVQGGGNFDSDTTLPLNQRHRVIVYTDTVGNLTQLYLNGVLQSATTTTTTNANWSSINIGTNISANSFSGNRIARLGFAHDTNPFSTDDILAIDAILSNFIPVQPLTVSPLIFAPYIIYDKLLAEEQEKTREKLKILSKILKGKANHSV